MEQEEQERLTELCRQGDPEATVEMFRQAHRTRDHRLFEIGLAGGLLCEDPQSDAKRFSYLLLAAMSSQFDMWESPIWRAVLQGEAQ